MKILVFSDSHGDVETMCAVVENEKPDMIVHLGDFITDANKLGARYPGIEMIKIFGNSDSSRELEDWTEFAEVCGKKIMLTHGHEFWENTGDIRNIDGIKEMALYGFGRGADIILFGHSHEPYLNCRLGRWLMNPGRIGRLSGKFIHATYGVLTIDDGNLQWRFEEVV